MALQTVFHNGTAVAVADGTQRLLYDVPSALELIMQVRHQAQCERLALAKTAVDEAFFSLGTGLAGEVLQKFVNYGVQLAIYGDYTRYTSKPLRDFLYESNRGNAVFFVATREEAIARLAQ